MKLIKDIESVRKDRNLEKLLAQRKAPLSPEGMQLALTDLTLYLTGDVQFIAAVFPKTERIGDSEMVPGDVEKADMMLGTDNERYFPVYTDPALFKQQKPALQPFESLYLMDKLDLLEFLQNNTNVSACVVNPGTDDLLLFRLQLQNMIQLGSGNIRSL